MEAAPGAGGSGNTRNSFSPGAGPTDAGGRSSSGFRFGENFAGFSLEDSDEGAGLDVGFVLSAFGGGQFAFVTFLSQLFDASLGAFADLEFSEGACGFDAKTAAHRFEHLLKYFTAVSRSV